MPDSLPLQQSDLLFQLIRQAHNFHQRFFEIFLQSSLYFLPPAQTSQLVLLVLPLKHLLLYRFLLARLAVDFYDFCLGALNTLAGTVESRR